MWKRVKMCCSSRLTSGRRTFPHSELGQGSTRSNTVLRICSLIIYAVETGLSSDPSMNARLSMLDDFALVSNSDAHSPQKLGREATCFDTDASFKAILDAIKSRDAQRLTGTLEFFSEQGKYHLDGHRKCDVCLSPGESEKVEGVCPVCGKPLTMGVMNRINQLADRDEKSTNRNVHFESLISLSELISTTVGVGPTSKRVQRIYDGMLESLGPELEILRTLSIDPIDRAGFGEVGEAVEGMRLGAVNVTSGYDGVFGVIEIQGGSAVNQTAEADSQTVSGEAFERS